MKARHSEIAALGACQFSFYTSGIEHLFDIGRDIYVYPNVDELAYMVARISDDEAAMAASRASERVAELSYQKQFSELFSKNDISATKPCGHRRSLIASVRRPWSFLTIGCGNRNDALISILTGFPTLCFSCHKSRNSGSSLNPLDRACNMVSSRRAPPDFRASAATKASSGYLS